MNPTIFHPPKQDTTAVAEDLGDLAFPAVLPDFRKAALAFPDRVKGALKLVDDPQVASAYLDRAEMLSQFARRVRADTNSINAIQYGKLLIMAKFGQLLPSPTPPEKRGRGHKKCETQFHNLSEPTVRNYRQIGANEPRIDDYREAIQAYNAELPEDEPEAIEMSAAGFLRFTRTGRVTSSTPRSCLAGETEWYTPAQYVEAARRTMGSIDLDPASNELANETVRAKTYFTEQDSGLERDWEGTVFLNPPFKSDVVAAFVAKLCTEFQAGRVRQAVLLTNNSTDTRWWHRAARTAIAVCFTQGRIRFYNADGDSQSPPNGHTFFFFGQTADRFQEQFESIGQIGYMRSQRQRPQAGKDLQDTRVNAE